MNYQVSFAKRYELCFDRSSVFGTTQDFKRNNRHSAKRVGKGMDGLITCTFCYLEHGVGEEGLQHAPLARGVGLVLLEQLVEVSVLLAVG